jgi:hypothetical protein
VALRTSTISGHQKVAHGTSAARRSPPRLRTDLLLAAVYLAMGLFVSARLWRDLAYRRVEIGSDHAQFIWFLRHAVRVVTEGVDPFATTMLNAPNAVNLMANTSALGLTIPMVPVTLLFGAEASFAALLVLGLSATAFGWYFVFRRYLVNSTLAAAVGGGFCGFAPGLISHANGHINWTAQFLVPFIVLATFRLRRARDGILLGLLITYQAFINEEVLLYTALGLAVFLLTYTRLTRIRRPILPILSGLLVAAGISALLLAYPLYRQFFGGYSYHGLPPSVANYRADLASYPAFSRLSFAGLSTSDKLSWNISEENTFLGWPLLLVAAAVAIWLWKRPLIKTLTITGAVFFVLSLGETLLVGRRNTAIPLPWLILGKLPLLNHVITGRFALVLIPLLGALLAVTIPLIRAIPDPRLRRLAVLGLVAALLPILPVPIPVHGRPLTPEFISSGEWRKWVAPGQSLVTIPVTSEEFPNAMEWQRSSTDFKLAGGYFLGPDDSGRARFGAPPRPTAALMKEVYKTGRVPIVTDTMRRQFREDSAYWNAAAFVLPDSQTTNWIPLRWLMNALAGQPHEVSDVTIWKP